MDDLSKTKQLQHEIRQTLKVLNWSQPAFASYYHDEQADYDDEIENKRSVERFKSYLKRPETSPERLEPYLEFLKESERYNKCSPTLLEKIQPHQGFITDYQNILDSEDDPSNKKVLEMAAAYALSIGYAYDFHIVNISEDEFFYEFIVIWEFVSRQGGSGAYGPAMCEINGVAMDRLSVEPQDGLGFSDVSARFISGVVGYENQQLTIIGLDRDEENWSLHHVPMIYAIVLEKNFEGEWVTTDSKFLGRVDDNDGDVMGFVKKIYSKKA